MPEIPDLQLHHPATRNDLSDDRPGGDVIAEDTVDGSDRSKWFVLIVLFAIAAGIIGYVVLRREKAPGGGESSSGLAFDTVRPTGPWPD